MSLEQGPRARRATTSTDDSAADAPSGGRGLASAVVARAAWVCWVRAAMPLNDLFGAVSSTSAALRTTGARWSGAGVLSELRSEWYGFAGAQDSCLLFAFDATTLPEVEDRRMALLRPLLQPYECRLSERGDVPNAIAREIRASRVVPVWELPGLAHLAPAPSALNAFPTLAA